MTTLSGQGSYFVLERFPVQIFPAAKIYLHSEDFLSFPHNHSWWTQPRFLALQRLAKPFLHSGHSHMITVNEFLQVSYAFRFNFNGRHVSMLEDEPLKTQR